MQNVVITGSSGFIGSHLAKAIHQAFDQIYIIGIDKNCANLGGCDVYHQIDLSSEAASEFLKHALPEDALIIHLASPCGVQYVIDNPLETFSEINAINNNLFKALKPHQPIIYASTSEIYGINSNFSEKEAASIDSQSIRSAYALAKLNGELLLKLYNPRYMIIRPFNIVGKGQTTPGMVIPNMIKSLKETGKIMVYGDGSNIRSYCAVQDAVKQMLALIYKLLEVNTQAADNYEHVYNIGTTSNSLSSLELARRIIELAGYGEIQFQELPLQTIFSNRYPITTNIEQAYKKYFLEPQSFITIDQIIMEYFE